MNKDQQFIFCQDCLGFGEKDGKICPTCLGTGIWAVSFGKIIFFDREISSFQLIVSKIKKILSKIIKFIFIIFIILGFFSLIQAIFQLEFLKKIPPFDLERALLMRRFWFSLILLLFLIYLKQKKEEKISLKKAIETKEKINVNDFLSESLEEVIVKSYKLMKRLNHFLIEPIHLFIAILSSPEGAIVGTRLGLSWQKLKEKITEELSKVPNYPLFSSQVFSIETKKILIQSFLSASLKKKEEVSPLEVFSSLSSLDLIKSILDYFEIKPNDVSNVIVWKEVYDEIRKDWQKLSYGASIKGKGTMNIAMTAVATPFLDAFSSDLTQLAKMGYLSVCLDREKEIEEIFRILEGGKNAVVLVGPPGVGKTSIIEGIARKMVAEEVPKILSDKRLVSLSIGKLVAGAEAPGEIERRIQMIISEIVRAGNIVLFIKDIHNLVGIKTTAGELDISEILAEAVEKKLFPLLSTSISGDYEKYLETTSLGQALSKVKVEEPDKNTSIIICEAKVAGIEAKNKVFFSYQAIEAAYDLAKRYIHERFFPEKMISLLEEAAVYVKNKKGKGGFVLKDDVSELVAKKTGIPPEKISKSEAELLLNLEKMIHQRIIDQEEAVKAVAQAIKRARMELREIKRPIANLLFLGPTGVGKTELAKTIAEIYFGSEEKMIRLDMSEFQTKEAVGRLIGDSREPRGILTEAVRKNPFTLLLLDEIEKSHPDVLNLFLQVMDDGRLTDWSGRTVDFTNLILIGTSNAGSDWVCEQLRAGKSIDEIKETLIKEKLAPYFKPEFLNRFDGIIVFKPLSINELKEITKLLLGQLKKILEKKGIIFEVEESAIEELAQIGFDPVFGARALKRAIVERVNDTIADFLLTTKVSRGDILILEKGCKIRLERRK
jgi:ATP-dependent Clp protease ATP-binding subunit ClpC